MKNEKAPIVSDVDLKQADRQFLKIFSILLGIVSGVIGYAFIV